MALGSSSPRAARHGLLALVVSFSLGLGSTGTACAAPPTTGDEPPAERTEIQIETRKPSALTEAPRAGSQIRIGGEVNTPLFAGGDVHYRAGTALIDTTLPEGYPAPTIPGAIEVKSYPSARRAEVSGTKSPDLATNFAFFRLFEHIQEREIAMTSPVEMDYERDATAESNADTGWTMSFLYRTPRMGSSGEAGRVTVVDRPAVTVISIGYQGNYGARGVLDKIDTLKEIVATMEGWEVVGPPRGLFYNGPNVRGSKRWGEAQLPIARVTSESGEEAEPVQPKAGEQESGKKRVFLNESLPATERNHE